MKKINLLVKYLPDGKMIPVQFNFQDQNFLVTDIGRSWEDEHGTHILVLTGQGPASELILSSKDTTWYIKQKPIHPKI